MNGEEQVWYHEDVAWNNEMFTQLGDIYIRGCHEPDRLLGRGRDACSSLLHSVE